MGMCVELYASLKGVIGVASQGWHESLRMQGWLAALSGIMHHAPCQAVQPCLHLLLLCTSCNLGRHQVWSGLAKLMHVKAS